MDATSPTAVAARRAIFVAAGTTAGDGMLDALGTFTMFDQEDRLLQEPPTDFTQFLSARLRLDQPDTLAVLGSFLLTFQPSGNHPVLASSTNFHRGE